MPRCTSVAPAAPPSDQAPNTPNLARTARRHLLQTWPKTALALWLGAALGMHPGLAHAQEQVQRAFPADALRGSLNIVDAPDVLLNGQTARLAPGALIRNTQNLLTTPASLTGQTLSVHYTVDLLGLIKHIWILRPDELARFWPRSAQEAANYELDLIAQTWTRRP